MLPWCAVMEESGLVVPATSPTLSGTPRVYSVNDAELIVRAQRALLNRTPLAAPAAHCSLWRANTAIGEINLGPTALSETSWRPNTSGTASTKDF